MQLLMLHYSKVNSVNYSEVNSMWPTDYPSNFDEEYVCDGVGCETCTFDPCYYDDEEDVEC